MNIHPRQFITAFALCMTVATAVSETGHETDDAFWSDAAALLPGFTGTPTEPGASNQDGRWGDVIDWPHVPVSAASLPNGKILTYSGQERTNWPGTKTQTYWTIYDPETGRFDESLYLDHEMFCAHLVMRADGNVQTVGGRYTIEHSSVFDFRSNQWKRVDDMDDRRWYTSSVALPDGDVFTVAGNGGRNTAERYSVKSDQWQKLTGIDWAPVSTATGFESQWWAYLMVAPNGELFHFGPTETMHWVKTDGNGARMSAGLAVPGNHYPKHAGVAMYASGKILVAGGAATTGGGSTNKAYTVDLNTSPPTAQEVAPMTHPRRFSNAVVLPSGEVMIIGGNTSGQKFSNNGSILTPEIWNPNTNTWREVADLDRPRNYHSVALLLADGRVFAGGNGFPNPNEQNGEIYTPPALFTETGAAAVRPVLTQAPDTVACGSVFEVQATPGLNKFAAIRLIATTHGYSTDQRYLSLPFSETSPGNYQLVAHPNVNVMVPGYWMLFGLDANGVHSKSEIVHVMTTGDAPSSGLKGDYHNGTGLSDKQFERIDSRVNYDFTTLSPDTATLGNDTYSVRWEGWVVPDFTGTFSFYTYSDDGVRLWVDGQQLVDNWTNHAPIENSGTISLTAGVPVPLKMEFYEDAQGAVAELRWSGPGTTKQIIPQRNLRHENPSGSAIIAADDLFELYVDGKLVSIGTEWDRAYHASFQTGSSSVIAIRACDNGEGPDAFALGEFSVNGEKVVTDGVWKVATGAPADWNQPGFDDSGWANATDYGAAPGSVLGLPVNSTARRLWAADANAEEVYLRLVTGAPRIGTVADRVDTSGQSVDFTIPVTAPAGASLTFGESGFPAGVELHPSTGRVTGALTGEGVFAASVTVTDQGGLSDSVNFQWVVRLPGQGSGSLLREWWTGVAGNSVADLLAHAAYPNSPSGAEQITAFPVAVNFAEDYGSRLRGYIHAPVTGTYRFWISTDNGGNLFLSSNDSPDNAVVIAQVPDENWAGITEWTKFPEQRSADITLQGGERYYLEALQKDGGGGDHINLAWQIPGDSGINVIDGSHLTPFQPNRAPVLVEPSDQAHTVGQTVSLALVASDLDDDPIAFSAVNLPSGLALDPDTGLIDGTLDSVGTSVVTINASDGQGGLDTADFTWDVNGAVTVPDIIPVPAASGGTIDFVASPSGGTNPRYRWNFGDGSGDTDWSPSPNVSHTYEAPGRYLVRFTAVDDSGVEVSTSFVQNIYPTLLADRPTSSQSVLFEERAGNDRVWNVNPDNDTVSVFDAVTHGKLAEIFVGKGPRCLALHPSGVIWVANKEEASIARIQTSDFQLLSNVSLPRGSQPHGLVFDPEGLYAYVALEATGEVVQFDFATAAEVGRLPVGPSPRHLAVTSDGGKLLVSRFITPRLPGEDTATPIVTSGGGEVLVLSTSPFAVAKTITLQHNDEPDSGGGGRGIPNYLGAASISPGGDMAWVPSKQDNVLRGTLRDGRNLTHENTVRAITSRIDLLGEAEDYLGRVDHDDAAVPSAAIFGPNGVHVFVACEGSREVSVIDAYGQQELFRFDVGRAPQGLALSADGHHLLVHNFLSRTVSVHDVSAVIERGTEEVTSVAVYNTVGSEALAPQVLLGKQIFYDARDNRVSREDYISCAACHNDGAHDGRVWDMTGFGEGLRNTIDLRGRGGLAHGPLHWSANFDEVQDFENQIRNLAKGTGLIGNGDPHPPLGDPNAGRSTDLDALAAYVSSLVETPESPFRQPDGNLTPEALVGRDVFRLKDCASCHSGSSFTDSAPNNLHDIGTIRASSGGRLGGALPGLDTPTLRGLWLGAPFLHDGSALTIGDAITAHSGLSLSPAETASLVTYLQQIDDVENTAPSNTAPSLVNPGNQVHDQDTAITLALTATDPNEDTLLYSAVGLPGGLVIDSATGLISGSVPAPGVYNVSVTVDDQFNGTDTASFTWTINVVNPAENDVLTNFVAPATVAQFESVVASVNYESTQDHELWIWLQDSNDGWRTVATDHLTLIPGIGTHTFNLDIAGDARVGDGYVWVVRLLPQGWASSDDALSADYLLADVQTGTGGGGGDPTNDQLGNVIFPTLVVSPGTTSFEVSYEVTETRELRVWLHDSQDGWFTIGQDSTILERGFGTHLFNLPILPNAREGAGYVWALRLMPVDWTTADDALDADYGDASVERGQPGGDPTRDVFISVDAPPTVIAASTASILIDYEATERREVGVWLHDANDNWRTIGSAIRTVEAGFGSEVVTLGIASDARLGDGHLWAIRLLPEGWATSDDALDAVYEDVTVQEPTVDDSLINLAGEPGVTTTQSSVFSTAFVADLAVDGNTDGDWRNGSVTHTELDVNAWWEVDLGSVGDIAHINVWNRTDCCGDDWLSNFHVLVSDVPFVSTDLAASVSQPGVSDYVFTSAPAPTMMIDIGRTGRYVRVQLSGANYLALAEVEVFGPGEVLQIAAQVAVASDGTLVNHQVYSDSNVDGDLLDLTAEYALGTNPFVADPGHTGLALDMGLTGETITVSYDRPARLDHLRYQVEHSADLRTWVSLAEDQVSQLSFGRERVSFPHLELQEGLSRDRGFVRLRLRHTEWNVETTTPVIGWYETTLRPGFQTHGVSLNRPTAFVSAVQDWSADGMRLAASGVSEHLVEERPYYIEFVSGSLAGHRIDVDLSGTVGDTLALDWSAPHNTLTAVPDAAAWFNAGVVIRAHWTLGEAYPNDAFHGGIEPEAADQLLFFNGTAYDSYFLLKSDGLNHWVAQDDEDLLSANDHVIPPGIGCFINRPADVEPLTLTFTGEVRVGDFVQPLLNGHNLLASPRPVPMDFSERRWLLEDGFTGARDPEQADQIQLWRGDLKPGWQGFQGYFLLDGGSERQFWTEVGTDLPDVDEEAVFLGDRAFFFKLSEGDRLDYKVPAVGSE